MSDVFEIVVLAIAGLFTGAAAIVGFVEMCRGIWRSLRGGL